MRESERKSESDFGPLLIFCKAAFNLPAAQRFTAGLQSRLPLSPQLPRCQADCQADCLPPQTSLRAAISARQRARPAGTQRSQHFAETARKIAAFERRVSRFDTPSACERDPPCKDGCAPCAAEQTGSLAVRCALCQVYGKSPGGLRLGPVCLAATRTRGRDSDPRP